MIANLPEDERAQTIRKVTPIVVTREALLSSQIASASVLRSRKRRLHYGTSSLFAVVEGNPRWTIGLMGPLLKQYAEGGVKVSASQQQRAIEVATARFRAMLKTIPYQVNSPNVSARGLLSLIDAIGSALLNGVVREKFQPDANAQVLNLIGPAQVYHYAVGDPIRLFIVLNNLVSSFLRYSRPTIVPFGPKVFAFVAMLVALNHYPSATVWRVSGDQAAPPTERKASGRIISFDVVG